MVWTIKEHEKTPLNIIGATLEYDLDGQSIVAIYSNKKGNEGPGEIGIKILSRFNEENRLNTIAMYESSGTFDEVRYARLPNFRSVQEQLKELKEFPEYGQYFAKSIDDILRRI